jgi:hypothetical protein
MSLVVEDGTNVPNANSYVTDVEYTDYAAKRGITVGATAPEREVELIKGMDYLASYRDRYRGGRTWDDQVLDWPRAIGLTDIPFPATVLKEAQILAAIASRTMKLFPVVTASDKFATRKTVGPLTVEYQSSSSAGGYGRQRLPQIDSLLRQIFGGGAGQVPVVRA